MRVPVRRARTMVPRRWHVIQALPHPATGDVRACGNGSDLSRLGARPGARCGAGALLRHREGGTERMRHCTARVRRPGEGRSRSVRLEARAGRHLRKARRQDQATRLTTIAAAVLELDAMLGALRAGW